MAYCNCNPRPYAYASSLSISSPGGISSVSFGQLLHRVSANHEGRTTVVGTQNAQSAPFNGSASCEKKRPLGTTMKSPTRTRFVNRGTIPSLVRWSSK